MLGIIEHSPDSPDEDERLCPATFWKDLLYAALENEESDFWSVAPGETVVLE